MEEDNAVPMTFNQERDLAIWLLKKYSRQRLKELFDIAPEDWCTTFGIDASQARSTEDAAGSEPKPVEATAEPHPSSAAE